MEQLVFALEVQSRSRTLVDDATGRILYAPSVVAPDVCAAWFAELESSVHWQHERRPMYDRIVDVPRLTAHYGPDDPLPKTLIEAKRAVERFTRLHFNSVGLNLYRDERDSVAMHNDHAGELIHDGAVALLSLGATRRMRIASKSRPRRTFDVGLEAGSVLLMAGAAQDHWEHGIPKLRDAVGARISLAFRQRPEG